MGKWDSSSSSEYLLANQSRIDKVDKRQEETMPTHFYHVSPKRLRVGQVIVHAHDHIVSLSDSPIPHHTIAAEKVLPDQSTIDEAKEEWKKKQLKRGKWFSYEVEPLTPVGYEAYLKEYQCRMARVIRFVGDARSLLANQNKKRKSHGVDIEDEPWGSVVRGTRNIRRGGTYVQGRGEGYIKHIVGEYERHKEKR